MTKSMTAVLAGAALIVACARTVVHAQPAVPATLEVDVDKPGLPIPPIGPSGGARHRRPTGR